MMTLPVCRCFNEMSKARDRSGSHGHRPARVRQYSSSSPIPMQSPGSSRPFSPSASAGSILPTAVTVTKAFTPVWGASNVPPMFGSLPASASAPVPANKTASNDALVSWLTYTWLLLYAIHLDASITLTYMCLYVEGTSCFHDDGGREVCQACAPWHAVTWQANGSTWW